ncbi:unnamed protein product, partial [Amoebophrya sp. A25]|eukprot:GSA25T00025501001.1
MVGVVSCVCVFVFAFAQSLALLVWGGLCFCFLRRCLCLSSSLELLRRRLVLCVGASIASCWLFCESINYIRTH